MRKKSMRICALVVGLSLLVGSVPSFAKSSVVKPEKLKIGVLSDTHYFSESLYSECEDFTTAMNSDRKMFKESGAIIDSALDQMIKDEVEMIVVSGDLTKDGEQVNHEEFADKLQAAKDKLKKKGVDTKIYVINGNHDINNPNGKDYSSGTAQDADRTTVEEFKEIYKNFGYGDDTEQYSKDEYKGGSLSYVAHPAEGFTLIAVDSGKYSADQTSTGQDIQETGGVISDDLLKWVEEKTKEAKAKGDAVMVMQHHGVIEHFSEEPTVMADYLVDNYKDVQERYAKAGVNNVFTGHMHANDISEYKAENGNIMYDIETGSLVTYPSPSRVVNVTNYGGIAGKGIEYDVNTKLIKEANYVDSETGETIKDLTAYGKKHTLSVEVVQTMLTYQLLGPAIDSINAGGGIRPVFGQLLGSENPQNVDKDLVTMAASMLPQSKDAGWLLEVSGIRLRVYYDAEAGQIKISEDTSKARVSELREISKAAKITKTDGTAVEFELPQELTDDLTAEISGETPYTFGLGDPIELYVSFEKAADLVSDLLNQVDQKILSNKENVFAVVDTAVEELLTSKVDDEHTVFDLVNEIYQGHLAGEENPTDWMKNAIAKVGNEGLLAEKVKVVLNNDSKTIDAVGSLLENITINIKDTVEKGNNSIKTSFAHGIIGGMIKNGADILKLFDLSTLVSEDVYAQINNLGYAVASSMAFDDNYPEDNNTKLVFAAPESQGQGGDTDENQGNSSNGNTGNNENTGDQGIGNGSGNGTAGNGNVNSSAVGAGNTTEGVQTGDETPLAAYVMLAVGALAVAHALKRVGENKR